MLKNVRFYAEEEPTHSIDFSTDELYTVVLSRLSKPFISFVFDKVTKKAYTIINGFEIRKSKSGQSIFNMDGETYVYTLNELIASAIRFGKSHISFSKEELEALQNNKYVYDQYREFSRLRKSDNQKPMSFGAYVHKFSFNISEPK